MIIGYWPSVKYYWQNSETLLIDSLILLITCERLIKFKNSGFSLWISEISLVRIHGKKFEKFQIQMDAGISKKSYSQILKVKYNPDKVFSYYIILYIISHFSIPAYIAYTRAKFISKSPELI